RHPGILLVPRMSTFFVGWNLLFPWLDFVYTVAFIPGLILACFGVYWVAGPMTLALLPMALLMNVLMYCISVKMFDAQGLRVRRNVAGLLIYVFGYSLILQRSAWPATSRNCSGCARGGARNDAPRTSPLCSVVRNSHGRR